MATDIAALRDRSRPIVREVPHTVSPGLWTLGWRRLRSDAVGMVSLAIVLLFIVMMILSGTGLVARDWAREIGVNYAPPTWAPGEGAARVNDVGVAVTNVSVYLAESPKKNPDASALVCDHTTTSHSRWATVPRFADYAGGLQRGDRLWRRLRVFLGEFGSHQGTVEIHFGRLLRANAEIARVRAFARQ